LQARNYVDVEVVRFEPRPKDPPGKVRTVREFNEMLGNPQAAFPVVQVAGTSGKGSTATCIAEILRSAGFRTGLHVSPYLQVATEKTWIDGRFESALGFHSAWQDAFPVAEHFRTREDCQASVHGMTSLALTWLSFRNANLDWAVVETGVGGRFDLVQGIDRKLAVITDLGLDHVKTLGPDLKNIAWHKAGIMEGCELAVAVRDPETWPVLEAEAAHFRCRLLPVHLPSTPCYQDRNKSVALAAVQALRTLGVPISDEHISSVLSNPLPIAGRLEVVQSSPTVILDAAHNHQKMQALVNSLPPRNARLILVMGATGERDLAGFAAAFPAPPDLLFLTRPLLYGKETADPSVLARQFGNWCPHTYPIHAPIPAIRAALDSARPEDTIVVTGSLYLAGQVRNLWHPWRDVLLQRTSFPDTDGHGPPPQGGCRPRRQPGADPGASRVQTPAPAGCRPTCT